MSDSPQGTADSPHSVSGDRLESWKEIAAYLRRDVKTVQRWEKREGMPVHRHLHDKLGSVFAFRAELDHWARNRRVPASPDGPDPATTQPPVENQPRPLPESRARSRGWMLGIAAVALLAVVGLAIAAMLRRERDAGANPLANARFVQLPVFNGPQQAAAISRDGQFVAFLSDAAGQMDVWLTQVGSGMFHNLTGGTMRALVNPSVRQLGFSPDGTLVTFWANAAAANENARISIWAVPVLGGSPRVYLEDAAEYQWNADATRMVFHTPGPGDPMFLRDGPASAPRQLFVVRPGLHGHFPTWSPDGAFVYFVQGTPGDRMDVWRLKPGAGTAPEQITHHESAVSYPVFLDAHRLLYLATDRDGSGPWIFSVDPDTRVSHRVSTGLDRFTSLAGTPDGRRLVATVATPTSTLWRMTLGSEPATATGASAVALTTGNGASPRFGNGVLLYVSSTGASDTIWRLQGQRPSQLWTSPETRVIGGPSLSGDEQRVAFSTRAPDGTTHLWVTNVDGTGARMIPLRYEVEGAPAWTPDGRALTVGVLVDGVPHLFSVPVDGGASTRMVQDASTDPTWSRDGTLVVFSGADVGTTFRVSGLDAAGQPRNIPELTLMRGARHLAFIDGSRTLVFLRGDLRHRDVWAMDVQTGAQRPLTDFGPGFDVRDFDITPDGRQLVVERVQEQSNIVIIELAR